MKRVSIIYANSYNTDAMDFVLRNLEEVFGDYVTFTNYYLDDFNENTLLRDDAYLTANEVSFQILKNYVSDYTTIIKVTRSPGRDSLQKIQSIPAGSDVLLVNDSYENSMETVASFNETSVGQINLTPYDKNLKDTGIYDCFTIAITPGEPQMVPPHIRNVIDIGYRKVSFDTMYTLMKLLDLDIDIINRNLFRHIQSVLEANTAFHDNYINSYLKSKMLNHMANKNKMAMILVDSQYRIVYANAKAASVFRVNDVSRINIQDYISLSILTEAQAPSETLEILEQEYQYNKYAFTLMDETVGYYITLQEKSDMADAARQNLINGYVAKYQFKDIIHQSPVMETVIDKARRIALTDYTLLIRGESGTGKELIVQSIHNASFRSNGPFIAVNCTSLPENLLESELFGYDSGAFTGARKEGKIGLFEQANHGTLFLDEIGDLPLSLQSRLLRVIQEKQFMRLGSDHLISVDVRIITATNRDLEAMVNAGAFRSDLFFRLNVLSLTLPSLRERKEDIRKLMQYFLGNAERSMTREEIRILTDYSWPGNVRELENAATYYNVFSALPDYLYHQTSPSGGTAPAQAQDLNRALLEIISAGTTMSHGIGRSAIFHTLKDRGISISDGKLRDILASLQSLGLIEIDRGRGGTRLTLSGADWLNG